AAGTAVGTQSVAAGACSSARCAAVAFADSLPPSPGCPADADQEPDPRAAGRTRLSHEAGEVELECRNVRPAARLGATAGRRLRRRTVAGRVGPGTGSIGARRTTH